MIESLNSQVGKYIGKVKRWHHSEQRHRWMALALLEAEQHMRRVAGYRDLPQASGSPAKNPEYYRE